MAPVPAPLASMTCPTCGTYLISDPRAPGRYAPAYISLSDFNLGSMCRQCVARLLNFYDAAGDGPAVNALCAYGRNRFGEGMYW